MLPLRNYFYMYLAKLQILFPNGDPAEGVQVTIKNPGTIDFGITDRTGTVSIPHKYASGSVIVHGQVVHIGDLVCTIFLQ